MSERSKRQGFLGEESDDILAQVHVGIVGLGGGGSHIVQQLAHVGVGRYTLVDDDRAEGSNLNRLIGATEADVARGGLKVTIAARQIKRILHGARITKVARPWQSSAQSLWGCDVIVGCLDTYDGRLQLEAMARRYLIPYIDLGTDVFAVDNRYAIFGQVMLSMPGMPCLKCLNVIREEWRSMEAAKYGASGGRPQVVWPNGVLASVAVGILIQLFAPWHDNHQPAALFEYDGNAQTIVRSSMLDELSGCPHFEGRDNLGDPWFELNS